ncbi:phosphonopyruvate decarboxylase [Alkaliflexus imshenetskii]|uniref:phosphonopyruvate decarboxylase n=1 Tax=Alkaliflexus imshenetskii TaxID=286730 RepID=UPI00047AD50F|nr:phosphonopyruvate decarboxylase [Alkaliflexus imshenetskii]
MIDAGDFLAHLIHRGVDYFCGVPDSLLKDFGSCVLDRIDNGNHQITVNEGSAIGLAVGHYLATGKVPLVYMQNSGLGNAVNPLISLADTKVYGIPMMMLIGWRGEPGVKDEPQHLKQGEIQNELLDLLGIPFRIIDGNTPNFTSVIDELHTTAIARSCPAAIVVRKDTFTPYKRTSRGDQNLYELHREDAIEAMTSQMDEDSIVVATTGKISRELYELREKRSQKHSCDFLTVGSMGHSIMIALGIAQEKPEKRVYCIDGDGAVLMHMGALATVATASGVENLIHIVLNNGAHESVGGHPTAAFKVDLCGIAASCGYRQVFRIDNKSDLSGLFQKLPKFSGPIFIEVMVSLASRADLGRPKESPAMNKEAFMRFIKGI